MISTLILIPQIKAKRFMYKFTVLIDKKNNKAQSCGCMDPSILDHIAIIASSFIVMEPSSKLVSYKLLIPSDIQACDLTGTRRDQKHR